MLHPSVVRLQTQAEEGKPITFLACSWSRRPEGGSHARSNPPSAGFSIRTCKQRRVYYKWNRPLIAIDSPTISVTPRTALAPRALKLPRSHGSLSAVGMQRAPVRGIAHAKPTTVKHQFGAAGHAM
ncbi:hypothetical protein PAPYR_3136 [Paratrimastix pyriformis]|uniref:Uncharacterized protein n=1 Tax=Paratrimastix pyriformis TaxID=342808 RepID=A0ABQ8UT40_9EUKA|nr:hypothetical protein PAPYR_3136 [Paratrimastix pyriformis]